MAGSKSPMPKTQNKRGIIPGKGFATGLDPGVQITEISIVSNCPYCGEPFDSTTGKDGSGKPCSHPTRLG